MQIVKNHKFTFLFIIVSLFFSSCSFQKKAVPDSSSSNIDFKKFETKKIVSAKDDQFIFSTIERTPCKGTCPVYKLIIFKSGDAIYDGSDHVIHTGRFLVKFSKVDLEKISAKAKEVKYFSFKNEYPTKSGDFPATITSLRVNKKVKSTNNRAGSIKGLSDFENFIEQMLFTKKFIPL